MKYLSFFRISFMQSMANRWSVAGRFLFYGIILFIFSKLWNVIEAKGDLSFSARDLVWYLAMTEWIILALPFVSREIEEDVKSGNLAYQLSRPVSYLWAKFASTYGSHLTRMIILSIAGFSFAYLFSGGLPSKPWGLLLFIPLAVIASALALIFQCIIGLSAFWTQDSFPLYLIWQKLVFVLGGMMLPLEIYPPWLKRTAELGPFPALLYEPAKIALTMDLGGILPLVLKQIFWIIIAAFLAQFIFSKACKGLNVNGG